MKTAFLSVVVGLMTVIASATSTNKTVALIVQDHRDYKEPGVNIPIMALTDALVANLAENGFGVINPHNVIGTDQNRSDRGEEMPQVSAVELARALGAQGALTASIVGFLDVPIGKSPIIGRRYAIRLVLSLADASSGAAVLGDVVNVEKRYNIAQDSTTRQIRLGDLMYSAADQCAKLLKEKAKGWEPKIEKPRTEPAPKTRTGRDDLGVVELGNKALQTPKEKIKTPTPPVTNEDFTIFDFEAMFKRLGNAMLTNARFKENYQETQAKKSNRPIVIIGAVTNKSVGAFAQSYGDFLAAIPDMLRADLGDAKLDEVRIFDTKDDEMSRTFAERILASDKSPVEDATLMDALKQHGSPDFVIVGDIRLFPGPAQRKTCRFHLALHSLYSGKIVWEGLVTAIK